MLTDIRDRLTLPRFPRANTYDTAWTITNVMGPNPLWLLEDLTADMDLRPGMRVLDLGCGRGLTSIFLAKEFGVQVWATDRWIKPTDNYHRFEKAGVADRVFPIHAEAHNLRFAKGYFDAVVSVVSYPYFGTDQLYLGYLTEFTRPGAQVAIAMPGVRHEVETPPTWLVEHWEWDFAVFHSAHWWRSHWARTGLVEVRSHRDQQDGPDLWRLWSQASAENAKSDFVREMSANTVAMLDADDNRTFAFPMLVAEVR